MLFILGCAVGAFLLGGLHFSIGNLIKDAEHRSIAREKIHQEWLFKSLYSISANVLLPIEHELPSVGKPTKIYKPEDNPMYEFHKDNL